MKALLSFLFVLSAPFLGGGALALVSPWLWLCWAFVWVWLWHDVFDRGERLP